MNYDDFVRGAGQVLAKTGDGDFKMVSMPNDIGVDSTIKVLEEGRFRLGGQGKEYKELIEGGGDLVNVKGMDWDEKNKLRNKAAELSGSDETGFMHQEKGQRFKKALNRYKKLFSKASKALPMLGILDIFNMKDEYDQIMAGEHPSGITSTAEKEAAKVYADGGLVRLKNGGKPGSRETGFTYQPKDPKPKVSKESTGRSAAIQKGIAENWQRGQDKKTAADDARADIIKRSQTGNVDRSDYEGGRHKYGMSVDDYHNMMATVPQNKYADMFPKSAGIPKLFSALGNLIPGMTMATNILNSIKGSDAGTMAKDLSNPFVNLFKNIFGKKTKATNPEAVSLVDNDWQEISDSTYNKVFKKENQPENIWWDVDATTADENRMISPMDQGLAEYYNQLKMEGPQGEEVIDDFSETFNPGTNVDDARKFLNNFWGGQDWDSYSDNTINTAIQHLQQKGAPDIDVSEEDMWSNAIAPKADEVWDTGLGTLTEPNIDALKAQIMGNPVTPNFGDLSQLYGINANAFNPEAYIQEQMALGNPPNINTDLFNRGGIASLQYGGQPGPFSDPTTVTEEETYDIQPLQMDPGIMGIPDLEDLFEEAKVKESIYDKLKYVNNTMHG